MVGAKGNIIRRLIREIQNYREYRANRAKLAINDIKESNYEGIAPGVREILNPDDRDTIEYTTYTVKLELENIGREAAVISGAKLVIPDSAEVIQLFKRSHNFGESFNNIRLEGPDRKTLYLTGNGHKRDSYYGDLEAEIKLDSTAGEIEREINLTSRNQSIT